MRKIQYQPIHLLHKITVSPRKMHLLRKSTSCPLQRIYLQCTDNWAANTTISQTKIVNNHHLTPPPILNIMTIINKQLLKTRQINGNVTVEGHKSLKTNPTSLSNKEISLLEFLDQFNSNLNSLISLFTTVLKKN